MRECESTLQLLLLLLNNQLDCFYLRDVVGAFLHLFHLYVELSSRKLNVIIKGALCRFGEEIKIIESFLVDFHDLINR